MLQAGVAEVTITPPVGVELAGYGFGPSVGVLQDLRAQALVLSQGTTSLALITVDLLMVGEAFVAQVRERVAAITGIPGSHVLIAASHSHSAPTAKPLRQWGRVDEPYARVVAAQLAGAVEMAAAGRTPARVGFGSGVVAAVSENRRGDPTGADTAVPVVRVEAEAGGPIAILTNFGCHPVTLHSYRNLLSPDYPGPMRATVRRVLGGATAAPTVMFTLGPSGDVNPAGYVAGATTHERSWQVGAILGCEVAKVALDPVWADDPELCVASEVVPLPVVSLPPLDTLRGMWDRYAAEAEAREAAGAPWPDVSVSQIKRDWAAEALAVQEAATAAHTVPCEISVLRVGPVGLVVLPLEVFTATSLAIKEASPAQMTVICTNANGGVGYLPTTGAYDGNDYTNPEGLAPKVYGLYALAPQAEPLVRARVSALLTRLYGGV